jgi:hypothetical protein
MGEEGYTVALLNYFKNIVPLSFNAILTFISISGTILRLQQKITLLCLLQNGIQFSGMISYNEDTPLKDIEIHDSFWD